jgi:predicted PurR-regulated permease PerM
LAALLLGLYGAFIVSLSDNVVKPFVLHGQSQLHPLLALLSILGGVEALGPVGILVGPMIVVFLQVTLNILHRELGQIEQKRKASAG